MDIKYLCTQIKFDDSQEDLIKFKIMFRDDPNTKVRINKSYCKDILQFICFDSVTRHTWHNYIKILVELGVNLNYNIDYEENYEMWHPLSRIFETPQDIDTLDLLINNNISKLNPWFEHDDEVLYKIMNYYTKDFSDAQLVDYCKEKICESYRRGDEKKRLMPLKIRYERLIKKRQQLKSVNFRY